MSVTEPTGITDPNGLFGLTVNDPGTCAVRLAFQGSFVSGPGSRFRRQGEDRLPRLHRGWRRQEGPGETGLSGWKFFLDADNDGIPDSGETNPLTDSGANSKFDNLPAGTCHVRMVQHSGWTRTAPSTGSFDVTLTAGETSTGKAFGERR